jgi:hypothetical protein
MSYRSESLRRRLQILTPATIVLPPTPTRVRSSWERLSQSRPSPSPSDCSLGHSGLVAPAKPGFVQIHMLACISVEHPRWRTPSRVPSWAGLGPARLRRFPQRFAALLGTDVSPARGGKPHSRSPNGLWREFPAGDIEQFNRQVEQCLRWESCLPHHAAQSCRSACAEHAGQLGCEYGVARRY